MKLRAFAPRTETGKKFIKALEKLSYRHSVWNIWTDFIKLTAISLSNAREPREDIRLARENQYQNLFDMYTTEEQALFIDMFACLMESYMGNPAQDFLGSLYMGLDFGNGWNGQFFTPWHVAEMMAKMNVSSDTEAELTEKGYVSVCDPTCGSGVMLLALQMLLKPSPVRILLIRFCLSDRILTR